MSITRLPEKRKITMGLKDDDATPKWKEKSLAPGAKILKQTGKLGNVLRDSSRSAKLPGKRTTSWGTTYWESRHNRSDGLGKKI